MCPIVPTFTCGFERSNFSLAMLPLHSSTFLFFFSSEQKIPLSRCSARFSNQHSAGLLCNYCLEDRTRNWWTGEDSNLRSPHGAADLQSAAINHSATRPQTANHGVPFSRREP